MGLRSIQQLFRQTLDLLGRKHPIEGPDIFDSKPTIPRMAIEVSPTVTTGAVELPDGMSELRKPDNPIPDLDGHILPHKCKCDRITDPVARPHRLIHRRLERTR